MRRFALRTAVVTGALLIGLALAPAAPAHGQTQDPCLIFVHGKQTNTGTFTSWSSARSYWVNGSNDFIRTATKNFQASY